MRGETRRATKILSVTRNIVVEHLASLLFNRASGMLHKVSRQLFLKIRHLLFEFSALNLFILVMSCLILLIMKSCSRGKPASELLSLKSCKTSYNFQIQKVT